MGIKEGSTMTPEEMRAVLRGAPDGYEARHEYIGERCGQLFGWLGGGDDQAFMLDWLPRASDSYGRPMRMLEVGTFLGSTARGLVTLSGGGTVTCIDNMVDVHWRTYNDGKFGSAREAWEHTLRTMGADLSEFAALIEGDSMVIGPAWDQPLDLVFIDANHEEPFVSSDIRNFAKWVVPGGYCLVDDTTMAPVVAACRSYFLAPDWEVVRDISTSEARGSLACWRRAGG